MKKIYKLLIVTGVSLAVCVCIAVAVFIRLSWCKVTFVCKDGCEHTVWQRIGETADYSSVHEEHYSDDTENKYQPAGIFVDEARVQYLFDTTLNKTSARIYLGIWSQNFHCTQFYTTRGTIRVYLAREEIQKLPASEQEPHGRALATERFYAAYEALGGSREEELSFAWRSNGFDNKWLVNSFEGIVAHMSSFSYMFGGARLHYEVEYVMVFEEGYLQEPIEDPFPY